MCLFSCFLKVDSIHDSSFFMMQPVVSVTEKIHTHITRNNKNGFLKTKERIYKRTLNNYLVVHVYIKYIYIYYKTFRFFVAAALRLFRSEIDFDELAAPPR